jgi:hypothetical protein
MSSSQIYIAIAIAALAVIAVVYFFIVRKKPQAKFSKLAGLAMVLILAGIIFGESRVVGYGLIGAGVLLAIVDIVRKMRKIQR